WIPGVWRWAVVPSWCTCALDFFFSSRRRHTRFSRDWSSDVCSSDLPVGHAFMAELDQAQRASIAHGKWLVDQCLDHGRPLFDQRSEERRVGKDRSSRWAPSRYTQNRKSGRTSTCASEC